MKRIMIVVIGSFVLALSGAWKTATAQTFPASVKDPFFGITYSPANVHFDAMPLAIGKRCKDIKRWRYVHSWIYSHVKKSEAEYFIVYGFIRAEDEKNPNGFSVVPEDDDGLIVELRSDGCKVDQWQFVLQRETHPTKDKPILLSDQLMDELAANLLARYARAFGGKKNFLSHLTEKAKDELPQSLRGQLEKFEQE
ncbi:MAG TPA: hypothetical protein VKT53_09340 [Candidatus Acidoferrum sp.]|nr:hypothetical protein [Candidatus Acidoferrum sp.]